MEELQINTKRLSNLVWIQRMYNSHTLLQE